MEYLPKEFIKIAKLAHLSDETLDHLIPEEISFELDDSERNDWHSFTQSKTPTIKNLKVLEQYSSKFKIKRIARRNIFSEATVYCDQNCSTISLFGITEDNAVSFKTFRDENELVGDLVDNYSAYKALSQDLKQIDSLSAQQWYALILLIEMFLEKYPLPDENWELDEHLVFTPKSLLKLFKSKEHELNKTWLTHWQEISSYQPVLTLNTLETALLMLASKKLIGQSISSGDAYFLSEELLLIIKTMAWWDRGFVIETDAVKMYLIQADSLYLITNENDQNYNILNVDGPQLKILTKNFINYITSTNKVDDLIEEESQAPKFCANCGKPVNQGAIFCGNCGHKLN